jgi:hypothetical protein
MNPTKKFSYMAILLLLTGGCASAGDSVWDKPTDSLPEPLKITVYRSPNCGCCRLWLEHLNRHQFEITDIIRSDMQDVKKRYGVPDSLASCHTAIIDGYVIEGHVPAADIKKLIRDKPDIAGLSVPGMPRGTPGMDMNDTTEVGRADGGISLSLTFIISA